MGFTSIRRLPYRPKEAVRVRAPRHLSRGEGCLQREIQPVYLSVSTFLLAGGCMQLMLMSCRQCNWSYLNQSFTSDWRLYIDPKLSEIVSERNRGPHIMSSKGRRPIDFGGWCFWFFDVTVLVCEWQSSLQFMLVLAPTTRTRIDYLLQLGSIKLLDATGRSVIEVLEQGSVDRWCGCCCIDHVLYVMCACVVVDFLIHEHQK